VQTKVRDDAAYTVRPATRDDAIEPEKPTSLPSNNDAAAYQEFTPIIASIDEPMQAIDDEETVDNSAPDNEIDESTWENPPAYELPGGMLPVGTGWIHPSEDPVMPEEAPAKPERAPIVIQPTIPIQRQPATNPLANVRSIVAHRDSFEKRPTSQSQARPEKVAVELTAKDSKSDDLNEVDPNDADMIIVEEDPVPPPPKQTSVRRQEYRQLFARLRRG